MYQFLILSFNLTTRSSNIDGLHTLIWVWFVSVLDEWKLKNLLTPFFFAMSEPSIGYKIVVNKVSKYPYIAT